MPDASMDAPREDPGDTPPDTPRDAISKFRILVSGDMVVDHHFYQGERLSPTERSSRGVRHIPEQGGAAGLQRLLIEIGTTAVKNASESLSAAESLKDLVVYTASLGIVPPDCSEPQAAHHAFAIWEPYPLDRTKPDKEKVWRANLKMGYGHEPIVPASGGSFKLRSMDFDGQPDLLILDDAGFLFRNQEHAKCWHLPPPPPADCPWILLKLSDPIAQGDLWRALIEPPAGQPGHADRLICLVSADDLRNETVRIGRGGSWESTLEDLALEFSRATLAPLTRCRHLVVVFGGDAVLWIDRYNGKAAHFCFVPSAAEGDFAAGIQGQAIGYLTAMAAALAHGLSQGALRRDGGLKPWMEAGLRAMRDLLKHGHGPVADAHNAQPNGYPVARLAKTILGTGLGTGLSTGNNEFAHVDIAWPPPVQPSRPWMIVESSQRPLHAIELPTLVGLAGEVVRRGKAAYGRLPHAGFGDFITSERTEIEMLRAIRKRMLDYKPIPRANEKPLAIGVFGPPGAGKSFAVREIATNVFGKSAWLEFNLSQFAGNAELTGALHKVRDKVLEGEVPVVFWDEFDTQNFKWLQYLLAPLQDGRFQDGALTHNVGRSVFLFAGGTSRTWLEFGQPRNQEEEDRLKLLKVPDFKSRLDAYYNVSGPNPRRLPDCKSNPTPFGGSPRIDPNDIGYTLRRALLIRGQLRLKPEALLEIDTDLLRALLRVPEYQHGARSLEKLVKTLAETHPAASHGVDTPKALRRSPLPSPDLLRMSVDPDEFHKLLDAGHAFAESRSLVEMAKKIHEAYRTNAHAANPPWLVQPRIDRPFDELDVFWQDDNIAAARRIPSVLALAGLGIEQAGTTPSSDGPDHATLEAHLGHNLERLAEAEHDGWWEFRRRNGWTQGAPRCDTKRIHPLMVPYADLTGAARERDRNTVREYPKRLDEAGYRAVWL